MPYIIIESFANGLDLRRSLDTAPPGSLRTLRNAFINEGGEIEKAKGFFRHEFLTTYAQNANRKGRIVGPFRAEVGAANAPLIYRHHHNVVPTLGFTLGAGTEASFVALGTVPDVTVWAMRTAAPLTEFGALLRLNSASFFGDVAHIVEGFVPLAATTQEFKHYEIIVNAATGEPTGESTIAANDNRPSMAILKDKAYFDAIRTVAFSAVADPGDMAGVGSGAFDTRTQSAPIGRQVGFGDYYGQLAVFGSLGCQFWDVDPDPAQNQYRRTIPLSAVAVRAITSYGDGDVVFLGSDGVRSLQARDSSNIASVGDFGSPIDKLIQAALKDQAPVNETTTGAPMSGMRFSGYNPAVMTIHPETGALWVCLHDKVYVYSHYPSAKVRAWSTFDLPPVDGGNVSARNGTLKSRWVGDICQCNNDLILRNFADETYLYGGLDGSYYDATEAEVVTPHMDMGRPGQEKRFTAVDLACAGEWKIEVSLDPTNVIWETIAVVTNSTHRLTGKIPMDLTGSHIALRLTSTSASRATVGQAIIYYDGADEK